MKAMFLKRSYVEKSKKTGRTMAIVEVYLLPHVRDDGSGELVGGQVQTYFFTNPNDFEIGKKNRFGDIVDIKMKLDERTNRGIPDSIETVQESVYDLEELVG